MNLFDIVSKTEVPREILCTGAVKLRGFAQKYQTELFAGLREVTAKAPFRHMVTPGGFHMSVAMTNCSAFGWITDKTGYRYDRVDPETKKSLARNTELFPPVSKRRGCGGRF